MANLTKAQSAQRVLRAGVVGAGAFGRLHAQKYKGFENVELAGITDPALAQAQELAGTLGTEAHADHHALIGKVDCVSIASPAATHAAIAKDFLKAGVHVLVEKPIAVTVREAEELIPLARQKNLILQTGHQERYVFEASGLLNRSLRPLTIECHRAGPFSTRSNDVSAALDLMTHDVDLVHALNPTPVVTTKASARSRPDSFSDEVTASLILSDGCKVSLFASRMAEARKRYVRIGYADGTVEIDLLARTMTNTTNEKISPAFFPSTDGKPGIADDPLGYAIAQFVKSVRTGTPPLVSADQAKWALATTLIILKAADSPATRPPKV